MTPYSGHSNTKQLTQVKKDIQYGLKLIKHMQNEYQSFELKRPDIELSKSLIDRLYQMHRFIDQLKNMPIKNNYTLHQKIIFKEKFAPLSSEIRLTLAHELKKIINYHQWVDSKRFGKNTEFKAWKIVLKSDNDLDFQKSVLEQLKILLKKGLVDSHYMATLEDRIRVFSLNQPQLYGTQGRCNQKGQWEIYPVQNPKKLKQTRKKLGLKPLSSLINQKKKYCFL
jgi:hypothetical protein